MWEDLPVKKKYWKSWYQFIPDSRHLIRKGQWRIRDTGSLSFFHIISLPYCTVAKLTLPGADGSVFN